MLLVNWVKTWVQDIFVSRVKFTKKMSETCSWWNRQRQHSPAGFQSVLDATDHLGSQRQGSPPSGWRWRWPIYVWHPWLCPWRMKMSKWPYHSRHAACGEGSWQKSGGRSRQPDLGGRTGRRPLAGHDDNDGDEDGDGDGDCRNHSPLKVPWFKCLMEISVTILMPMEIEI